ncbi:hypothetical protein PVAG01_02713 [Phlyctema vagabunda]|uniref:DUF8004 domain-containing protein n=1 Tax=Phlyctema vagabunda TaxID=108571 RepID=A0ABR4PRD3_9HELO
MSGRSAIVRKKKTQTKDIKGLEQTNSRDDAITIRAQGPPPQHNLISEFPMPSAEGRAQTFEQGIPYRSNNNHFSSARSVASTGSDEKHRIYDGLAYARVQKPQVPVLDVSGIEKSSFRNLMDKQSDGIRRGLAKKFGKKKKDEEDARPPTSATIRADTHELDTGVYEHPVPIPNIRSRQPPQEEPEYLRAGPPQTSLPPVPQGPQMKRWIGSGRAPQPWNKLRKDPELWDPNGDTLVYFGHETAQPRQPPSFRLSSHILEGTESRFLVTLLREGATDDMNGFSMPPSPVSSPGMRPGMPAGRQQRGMPVPTPPMSERSSSTLDGQISYEIYFPSPPHLSKADVTRHQITTRNLFALLYGASLVGTNLFQALSDLHERLESWMPSDTDNASQLIEYVVSRGIDDVRNDPSTAASLLAWSETKGVRWEEGWRESYVHCTGMYSKLERVPEYRFITPISRALLERASLEIQVRIQSGEERFLDFDFGDMWPMMSSQPPPARASFERLRKFFCQHYEASYGSWPPANLLPPHGSEDQWLTRGLAQRLQKDFGALYEYLVNRDVVWDCNEESSGRKWNMIAKNSKSFEADSPDLPLTDILVAFDNRHKYPHIPHPYPLVPESISVKSSSRENLFKANKRTAPKEDKMTERRAALAYTESTNIYILSDFSTNELVDAYVRFEKTDKPAEVDPYAARRGRWVLIYGVLQVLATIAVDTPNMRYNTEIAYHLSPRLRGTPPWKGANQATNESSHENSYCWIAPRMWNREDSPPPPVAPMVAQSTGGRSIASRTHNYMSSRSSAAASESNSDAGSSVRTSHFSSSSKGRRRAPSNKDRDGERENLNYSGYSPGIGRVDEWPIREESQPRSVRVRDTNTPLLIKDFDDYNF